MRGRAFKEQFRLSPPEYRTPSPPLQYIEPLTPIDNSGGDSFPLHSNNNQRVHESNTQLADSAAFHGSFLERIHRGTQESPRSSDPPVLQYPRQRPSNPPFSPAQGSPIDTLANAASSLAPSPIFAQPSGGSSQAPLSPTNVSFFPPIENTPRHGYQDHTTAYSERPAKRARSEFFQSPPQHTINGSRPATSHVPSHSWSYNVEQMVDSGRRMYQDGSMLAGYPPDNSSNRLSDAQLLLDFQRGANSFARPSHSSMNERWSTVQPPNTDLIVRHSTVHMDSLSLHWPPQSLHGIPSKEPHHPFGASIKVGAEATTNGYGTASTNSGVQTHTPPEDAHSSTMPFSASEILDQPENKKPRRHQGWPKGKPRGPRASGANGKKRKASSKTTNIDVPAPTGVPDQLHSPQSLPADSSDPNGLDSKAEATDKESDTASNEVKSQVRRHSLSDISKPASGSSAVPPTTARANSVPPDNAMTNIPVVTPPSDGASGTTKAKADEASMVTVCAGCNFTSSSSLAGESQKWISCDGCKGWFHFACAGFQNEREVRNVDKYFCKACKPKHGPTTFVRKSARAHTTVDYAGLNEGVLRTSDDNPEHHYIQPIKDGSLQFLPETFARLPPEIVSADFFEKTNGFREPVVIPASLNPRPKLPGSGSNVPSAVDSEPVDEPDFDNYEYDCVHDDGQDKLDMVIPQGLTVRRVADLYGPQETLAVIDVKSQEGEDKRWNLARWADYYEQEGEKVVRNVISLEVSHSKMGRLIRRPKVVRDMDLQDSVWPEDDKKTTSVQFYCLMSVADCYTDFHIDFGGSSVYYHIVKGKKTFFFIPPTKQNLKKYEDWCLSPAQNHTFLPHQVKGECYRVDLSEGDTMLIPSGWIHAVWTPENSLVIGGNFLTRLHYDMQIRIAEIEKNTKVGLKFRYPRFQKVLWYTVLKYLEDDPLPSTVAQLLEGGQAFPRNSPIWCEPNKFGHNSDLGPENYHARYYAKHEIEGLPTLVSYIWRTVLISLGCIDGITAETRNAVIRSIPKKREEPLTLARKFAMWVAWKKGNEELPQWAYPDAKLPEVNDPKKKKANTAAMERKIWSEAYRATRERQPGRLKATMDTEDPTLNGSRPSSIVAPPLPPPINDTSKHLSTPKTSQLGPKRIACDVCRKRRIRCKHKDELLDPAKNGAYSAVPLQSLNGLHPQIDPTLVGLPAPSAGQTLKRRYSELDTPASISQASTTTAESVLPSNGVFPTSEFGAETPNNKSGRVKACLDCRKSKRRCIHDENGNIDPIKASEAPVPRGSATKKRRISDEDVHSANKKIKKESALNGIFANSEGASRRMSLASEPRTEVPTPRSSKITEIQDSITVYSPIKVPDPSPSDDEIILVNNSPFVAEERDPTVPNSERIISSVEDRPGIQANELVQPEEEIMQVDSPQVNGTTAETPQANAQMGDAMEIDVSSPPIDLAQQISSDIEEIGIIVAPAPASALSLTSGSGWGRPKASTTPRPRSSMGSTPKFSGISKARRDSKDSIRLSAEQMPPDDEASLKLALQLQQAEYGLRRRSK